MKKIIISVVLALLMLNSYSQEKKKESKNEKKVEVSEVVKNAFATKFPNATKVEWSLEKPGEFEVEFKLNKTEMSALFDEKGTLLETESEIEETDLPGAIKATLAKDFAGYKLDEIEKTDAKGEITYEMEAKKDNNEFELVFGINGKLLKQKEEKEEKD